MTVRIGWWLSMAVSIDGAGSVTGLDAVDVPVYADAAARDAAIPSPTAGQIVFVTGTGSLVYNGAAWVALGAGAANFTNTATGDYVSDGISYKYITFTGIGELVVDQAGFADILVIGGGGGGGNLRGGGGGSATHLSGNFYIPLGTLTVVIGSGGAGASSGEGGSPGIPSSLNEIITSSGGGGGGKGGASGRNGASGGGGGDSLSAGQTEFAGLKVSLFANDGGQGVDTAAGGGGGSGAVGANGAPNFGGAGGAGSSNSLTNSAVTRCGGGGGSALGGRTPGAGGSGGGGAGSLPPAQCNSK